MKKILEFQKDMENQVNSIKATISDIIDIANLSSNTNEVSDLLLSECKMITSKIGNYEVANSIIKNIFEKI